MIQVIALSHLARSLTCTRVRPAVQGMIETLSPQPSVSSIVDKMTEVRVVDGNPLSDKMHH